VEGDGVGVGEPDGVGDGVGVEDGVEDGEDKAHATTNVVEHVCGESTTIIGAVVGDFSTLELTGLG